MGFKPPPWELFPPLYMPISSILFFSSLVLGTITSLTAPNWLIAWLGIEINLLSFIPLITFHALGPLTDKTNAACKYFIAQATGSVLFLLAPAVWTTPWARLAPVFIIISLITKAGIAPIFQWFPSTLAALNWFSASILLTWQKLTPLLILFTADLPPAIITPLLLLRGLNAITGAVNGLAQTQLRPLLAFSSIAHIGWMLALSTMSSAAATGYLFCYILIVLPLLILFVSRRVSSPKTLPSLKALSPVQLFLSTTLLLNLAGLPPLGGFCLKAARLAILGPAFPIISLILIFSSVATLGFYINVSLLSLVTAFESISPLKPATSPLIGLILSLGTLAAIALPIVPIFLF